MKQDGTDYFDYHHTPDDTVDKIDPEKLKQNVAAYVVFLWIAANTDVDFRPEPPVTRRGRKKNGVATRRGAMKRGPRRRAMCVMVSLRHCHPSPMPRQGMTRGCGAAFHAPRRRQYSRKKAVAKVTI